MVMNTAGLETKNDCAGEGQQQLTLPDPDSNHISSDGRAISDWKGFGRKLSWHKSSNILGFIWKD
jgi:hypothetical protein